MNERPFSKLPDSLSDAIHRMVQEIYPLQSFAKTARIVANSVLKQSDFYIDQPRAATPWDEKWCQVAQVAYFLPLNFLRSQSVLNEARSCQMPRSLQFVDFGCGLGAGSLPWMMMEPSAHFTLIESSGTARRLFEKIAALLGISPRQWSWAEEKDLISSVELSQALGIFSYSLTELQNLPKWAFDCRSLMILEPATRDDGRRLLSERQRLIDQKFSLWAPCTHQGNCPVLVHSKTDWCHDRISIEMPDWFLEIESHLSIKNPNLTFSYLLASRERPLEKSPAKSQWRITGDSLLEKGKTRQMICRGPEREYLSFMHKNFRPKEIPEFPRGSLIDAPQEFESKANELRVLKL